MASGAELVEIDQHTSLTTGNILIPGPFAEWIIFTIIASFLFIMVIQHKQLQGKGMFYVGQDGAILAEMVYSMASNKMIIEHTEVDDSLSGKGVGKQLVHTAVEYARTHNLKIVPLCPYAKSVLDKMKEWQDVLA